MTGTLAVVVFVVGLVASIMVHEWGHFATARRFGMRADRFFLGFGPTLWSTRRGETEYGVKALPLGGFVRIRGMGPDDERKPDVPSALASAVDQGEAPVVALRRLLLDRGASAALTDRLAERFGRNAPDAPTGEEAATLATRLVVSEVPTSGRVGDLHHRLLRGDEGRFFSDRPAWQRAIVLASGSLLHFAQAAVLLFLGFLLFGSTVVLPVVDSFSGPEPDVPSAAEEAGLQVGDRILAVAGVASDDFDEIRDLIRERPGVPTSVTYERDGERAEVLVTPSTTTDPETGEEIGLLGFLPATDTEPLPADEALYEAFLGPGSFTDMFTGTFSSLGRVFGPQGIASLVDQLGGDAAERDPEGGISIVGAAGAAGEGTAVFGPLFLFVLLANVNVFVGIFNALPLPPLDGGHLAVLGVEQGVNAVRGRRGLPRDFTVNPATVASIAVPVIVLVATVSLGLLWLDLTNPISLQ